MKKMVILLMTILVIFSLCACANSQKEYSAEINGRTYEIDTEKNIVTDGRDTYSYTFSGDSSNYSITITYPNGSTYHWSQRDGSGSGGWSDDYDDRLYVSGSKLCDVIAGIAPEPSNPGNILAGLLLIGFGAFTAAAPHTAWYLEYGWRFKDAEPSELAIGCNCVGGIVVAIIGIVILFL